jgi:uncharacterized membrane protein
MIDENCAALSRIDKRSIAAVAAGMLIGLGLVLQWIEVLFTHVVARNTWFFATLFDETWNMINIWLASVWDGDLHYWPLLLVITGAAILLSRGPKRSSR